MDILQHLQSQSIGANQLPLSSAGKLQIASLFASDPLAALSSNQLYGRSSNSGTQLFQSRLSLLDNSLDTAQDLGRLRGTRSLSESVGNSDRDDYFKFTLNSQQNISLTLNGVGANVRLDLYRRTPRGTCQLVGRSETQGDSPAAIALNNQHQGTYYLRVRHMGGSETEYNLQLMSDQAGNTLSSARQIGNLSNPRTYRDFVGDSDARDFYRFTITEPTEVTLVLDQLSEDADIYLIQDKDQDNLIDQDEVIASSFNGGAQSEQIVAPLTAGTYHVLVNQYSGDTNYRLKLSSQALAPLPEGVSSDYGYGLVDAAAAIARATGSAHQSATLPLNTATDWALDLVQAPEAWQQGFTGDGVVVAVVDTGVDYTHPDLNQNIWRNPGEIAGNGIDDDNNGYIDDIRGWNFVDDTNRPLDEEGHGTHVSGTIAAEQNGFGVTGVAYNAQIMPVQVLDDTGSGTATAVAQGIRYAADNGADVINLSLGGSYSRAIENAVRYASRRGSLVIMAAGNDAEVIPGYPARHAEQWGIAVGAIDWNRNMASFSNRMGARLLNYVVAPGVNVYSTTPNNSYAIYSGTSMAAPHVAGVAALVLSANPNLTPNQLEALLTESANSDGITV